MWGVRLSRGFWMCFFILYLFALDICAYKVNRARMEEKQCVNKRVDRAKYVVFACLTNDKKGKVMV